MKFPVLVIGTSLLLSRLADVLVRLPRGRAGFADLGPQEPDMARVRVEVRRGLVPLGEDAGYLWCEQGAVLFHGSRLSFRLPSDSAALRRRLRDRLTFPGKDGVRVYATAYAGERIRLDGEEGTGPWEFPPVTRDPSMKRPNLAPRAVAFSIGGYVMLMVSTLTPEPWTLADAGLGFLGIWLVGTSVWAVLVEP